MHTDPARAACRDADPELYFPIANAWDLAVDENARRAETAKAICATCPLLTACREYALDGGDPHAILGGLLPEERTAARQARTLVSA